MIERAYIHVGGPHASGKTAFIEAVLGGADGVILAARCVHDAALREGRETRPRSDLEIRRYLDAGAIDAARYAFADGEMAMGSDEFFMTQLMTNYSQAGVVEGENPLGFVDLDVFVAPTPRAGECLLVRRRRDAAARERETIAAWGRQLRRPEGLADLLAEELGPPGAELARTHPELFQGAREAMLASLDRARKLPPRPRVEHWAVTKRYAGIERAGLVVVNIRQDRERDPADRLAKEVERLRKDEEVFKDVVSFRGHRIPITVVVADVGDPADPGLRKALARVRRTIRRRTSRDD